MLNVAFCDDDQIFLNMVCSEAMKIFNDLKVSASINLFTNADILIKNFENYRSYYDIVFLDIDMPIINGKETAGKLRMIDRKFKLIFITSFENEVLDTFQYGVSDFLPKLMLNDRLPSVIERVVNSVNEEKKQTQFFKIIASNAEIVDIRVPIDDIIYIESINRKIYLHTKRNVYVLSGYKFTSLIGNYLNHGFVDIHRTCIVNLKYLYSVGSTEIYLDDGTALPLSRRKKQDVLDKFTEKICEVIKW